MQNKIVSLEQMDTILQQAKSAGKRIVFTNGCFDLLHVGHLRSLTEAKNIGDILIVGLNDDQSVSHLKGPGRPLFPDFERAELVAGFECVDFVVIFSGETVAELLQRFKPHVHAKGTDYTQDTVPERAVVQSYGGQIAITGDPKMHSSSDVLTEISRLKEQEPGSNH
ncbi:adenylyltransferase/cytidyltransferase family protein [candidate division CSSED10-310 bacterium]|uniref:Adenylyltransferase/cytidyltransferase family protein n=1 Tax=candidate division CSSED10-310 bacterium TaxID=2855610 RepID=A0ABV6YX23_UNCC1